MLDLHLNLTPEKPAPSMFTGPVAPDENVVYDLLVIGAGPAGLNAALYAKRKGRNVAVFGDRVGGQMLNTSMVENYIGTSQNSGYELSQKFGNDIEALGIPILSGYLIDGWQQEEDDVIKLYATNRKQYRGKTVLLATGSTPRKLGIPGEIELADRGVSYCAICDGPLFKQKRLIVAGGGNAAAEAALDLARIGREVTVVQRSEFRADHILMAELEKLDNVTLLTQTQIERINGEEHVENIEVYDKVRGKRYVIEADAVFVEIGHDPNLGPFKMDLEVNDNGEIIVDQCNRTNIPGVFAAGDVTETMYKQIVIAAADGAQAALSINNELTTGESRMQTAAHKERNC